jgi:hypothetical protein
VAVHRHPLARTPDDPRAHPPRVRDFGPAATASCRTSSRGCAGGASGSRASISTSRRAPPCSTKSASWTSTTSRAPSWPSCAPTRAKWPSDRPALPAGRVRQRQQRQDADAADRLADRRLRPRSTSPASTCVHAAYTLSVAYPGLEVLPVCATTPPLPLPDPRTKRPARRVVYFPARPSATSSRRRPRVLRGMARVCGAGGGLLIGSRPEEGPALLHAAYNDARGVTAAFNLNLLARATASSAPTSTPTHRALRVLQPPPRARRDAPRQPPGAAGDGRPRTVVESPRARACLPRAPTSTLPAEFARLAAAAGHAAERVDGRRGTASACSTSSRSAALRPTPSGPPAAS